MCNAVFLDMITKSCLEPKPFVTMMSWGIVELFFPFPGRSLYISISVVASALISL